jgi:hypothetical protein
MQTAASPLIEASPSFAGDIGLGRQDMTPRPGIYCHNWGAATHEVAESIHRPLYAYALAFRQNGQAAPFVLATLDYGWFLAHETVNQLRAPVLRAHGLSDEQLWLSVTHSHSVPHIDAVLESKPGGHEISDFRAQLVSALSTAVSRALADLSPAVLTVATGQSRLARRRDFIEPDSGRVLCGPRPDEIADSTLLVGRISGPDGRIRGTFVNYACHPVSLGAGNTSVSPDYVGALRAVVEEHTQNAPCIFIHGASGNQTPRDSYASDPLVADRNGESLAYSALAVLRGMLPPGQRLEFAHRQESGAPLAIFEHRPYALDTTLGTARVALDLPGRSWPSNAEVETGIARAADAPERVRMERLKAYLNNLAALKSGFPVWAVRMGEVFFIGTPAEPFTDLQIALRARFGRSAIIVANDVNGSFNYLPPAGYYGNGAYEQDSADFGPGSLEIVTEGAAMLIERLGGR